MHVFVVISGAALLGIFLLILKVVLGASFFGWILGKSGRREQARPAPPVPSGVATTFIVAALAAAAGAVLLRAGRPSSETSDPAMVVPVGEVLAAPSVEPAVQPEKPLTNLRAGTVIHEGPARSFKRLHRVTTTIEVAVLDRVPGWVKVDADGIVGWVADQQPQRPFVRAATTPPAATSSRPRKLKANQPTGQEPTAAMPANGVPTEKPVSDVGDRKVGAPCSGLVDCEPQCLAGRLGSCTRLGLIRLNGRDASAHHAGANLLSKACDGGESSACRALGMAYRQGKGVVRNHAHALKLFEKGCAAGDKKACGLSRQGGAESETKAPAAQPKAGRGADEGEWVDPYGGTNEMRNARPTREGGAPP